MVGRTSAAEITGRLATFEHRYGMSTAEFLERYQEDETVPGVHPHVAALWYGGHRLLRRLGCADLEHLEGLLAPSA